MKYTGMSLALVLSLAACSGGNPFETGGGTGGGGGGGGTTTVPTELAGDLKGYNYDPAAGTLTISGTSLEDGPFTAGYARKSGLDRAGYQAFTAQDGSLDRHSTAYAKNIRGTSAVAVMTGGQFGHVFHGGSYSRNSYSAPVPPGSNDDGGLVTYAGNYVGMLNAAGSGEDLLPVAPGTPNPVRPTQAAEVTGRVVINASFSDGAVNGTIYERSVTDAGVSIDNVDLAPTSITADGTFGGNASINNDQRGTYGGLFGGTGATEVAGVVHLDNHIAGSNNVFEHGVFVLGQCGQPGEDPVCDQPVR